MKFRLLQENQWTKCHISFEIKFKFPVQVLEEEMNILQLPVKRLSRSQQRQTPR